MVNTHEIRQHTQAPQAPQVLFTYATSTIGIAIQSVAEKAQTNRNNGQDRQKVSTHKKASEAQSHKEQTQETH
jgi:hypothetical protein